MVTIRIAELTVARQNCPPYTFCVALKQRRQRLESNSIRGMIPLERMKAGFFKRSYSVRKKNQTLNGIFLNFSDSKLSHL